MDKNTLTLFPISEYLSVFKLRRGYFCYLTIVRVS